MVQNLILSIEIILPSTGLAGSNDGSDETFESGSNHHHCQLLLCHQVSHGGLQSLGVQRVLLVVLRQLVRTDVGISRQLLDDLNIHRTRGILGRELAVQIGQVVSVHLHCLDFLQVGHDDLNLIGEVKVIQFRRRSYFGVQLAELPEEFLVLPGEHREALEVEGEQ